jgi:AraC family transcriptional regulator, transcriptional activator of pobA
MQAGAVNAQASSAPIPVYTMRDMGLAGAVPGFEIRRLEDAFQRSKRDVRPAHRHDFYKVGLITAGRGRLSADFAEYPIRPPMLLEFAPGVVHGWRPDQLPHGYVINFDRTFFGQDPRAQAELLENNLFCVHSGPRVLSLTAKQQSLFEQLAEAMQREAQARGADHAAALLSYLRLWLIEAGRVAQALQPARWNDRGADLTNRFLCLVGGNYKSLTSVSDYATRLGVTSNHLNETVRRTMHKTAGQVIRERMLLEAKRLLLHSDLSVSEIAYQLSFEDPSYFARFFRKHTGKPPAEFRAQF